MADEIQMFTKPGCSHCAKAKAILKARGLRWRDHDVTVSAEAEAAARYLSGSPLVPQIFAGRHLIGGAEELERLDTGGLLDRVLQSALGARADLEYPHGAALTDDVADVSLATRIPKSDGTHDDDPETWPLLHFYKAFFGFWPNTFAYLHHWPEAYKLFVYCHNFSAVGLGRQILGDEMMFAIAYSTSNAQGCSYCQTHSAAIGGRRSLQVVADTRKVLDHDAPVAGGRFDAYQRLLIGLAARASRNTVGTELIGKIRTQATAAGRDVEADLTGTSMVVSAFGFLNVFNDLVGMDIEGDWARSAQQAGIAPGRHGVETGNPDNLDHPLPDGGPSMQDMLTAYDARVGDPAAYARRELGLYPAWMADWPAPLGARHAYLYGELTGSRDHCMLESELKHLMARVSAIAKGHDYLAAVEAFIAHHAARDRPRAIRRIRACYAVAIGLDDGANLFTPAERAALTVAWLSAQIPLTTPRRFILPALDHYGPAALIHLFTVCGIASLLQRHVAIHPQILEPEVTAFLAQNGLERDTLRLRHPLAGSRP